MSLAARELRREMQEEVDDALLCRAPVVLGNAPSAGSTLLRAMLGRSPTIATGGELAILDKTDFYALSTEEYRRRALRSLERAPLGHFAAANQKLFARIEEYPWTQSEIRDLCMSADSHTELAREFFGRNVKRLNGIRWLEKTPDNVYAFEHIQAAFPSAKFVQIVRDGRDSVASLMRRGFPATVAASRWYCATLAGIQFSGRPEYLRIRYEDLVNHPVATMADVCAHIGLPFTSDILSVDVEQPAAIASWRNSEYGPLSPVSIRQFRDAAYREGLSSLRTIRVTRSGCKVLPLRGRTMGTPDPLELQDMLGYGLEGLVDAKPLSNRERARFTRYVLKWKWKRLREHGRIPVCPVTVWPTLHCR